MNRRTWFLGALLLAGSAGVALADTGGVNVVPSGPPVVTEPAREGLVDAWNDTQPWDGGGHNYSANCFGYAYTPALTYTLNRVEFYAGGRAGQVTVEILADDGSGFPSGPVLGSVTYVESATEGWQGQSLNAPVALTAGTLYYIRYHVVLDAYASFAASGVFIPHTWSYDDGVSWEGPLACYHWMARFYGDEGGSPVVDETWGGVKSIFR